MRVKKESFQKNFLGFFVTKEGILAVITLIFFFVLFLTTNLNQAMFVFLKDWAYLLMGWFGSYACFDHGSD